MLRLIELIATDIDRVGVAASTSVKSTASPLPMSASMSTTTLTLSFEDRRRSRQLVRLGDGREAALMLPRGTVLRDGDRLRDESRSVVVVVRAAAEELSFASTADVHLLTRAAYHLGNRHIPVQVGAGWLAYQHDHVLDALARDLGLDVTTRSESFEPEAGGYKHAGSAHGHAHGKGDHHHDDDGHHGHSHAR
jgi:urease accessory protein